MVDCCGRKRSLPVRRTEFEVLSTGNGPRYKMHPADAPPGALALYPYREKGSAFDGLCSLPAEVPSPKGLPAHRQNRAVEGLSEAAFGLKAALKAPLKAASKAALGSGTLRSQRRCFPHHVSRKTKAQKEQEAFRQAGKQTPAQRAASSG